MHDLSSIALKPERKVEADMPTIHFLNVKEGDCIVVEHYSGNKTVIDVCNARPIDDVAEAQIARQALSDLSVGGNFQQKRYPVNPISYFRDRGWSSRVFRFVLTHPDMDHLDGVKAFFESYRPINFWDTDNSKQMDVGSWNGSQYSETDWEFYKRLRESDPDSDPKRLTLLSGQHGQYYNEGEGGEAGGDGLFILAPTEELVKNANDADDDYNDCSYVLLYRTGGHSVVFGGDSHDDTWEHILNTHEDAVTDIDILIAPHHGRKSKRSYDFLDVLRPKITFFGNARSEYLAYGAWNYRKLPIITNNQAGCIIADVSVDPIDLYVTHKPFATRVNPDTYYSEVFRAYYIVRIE